MLMAENGTVSGRTTNLTGRRLSAAIVRPIAFAGTVEPGTAINCLVFGGSAAP